MYDYLKLSRLFIIIASFHPLSIEGANILAISTLASPSHHNFHHNFLLQLAEQGHNVTFLSHDSKPVQHVNYTQILLEGVYEELYKEVDIMSLKNQSTFEINMLLWDFHSVLCSLDFQTNGLKRLKEYPDDFKFDLIIWDICSGGCLYPLVEKFGYPPVIGTNPYINQPDFYQNVYQSFLPHGILQYTNKMNLWERFHSNFWNMISLVLRNFYYNPKMNELAHTYFGDIQTTLEDFERNISIILANYNPVSNFPEALPPNIIPVGGLHIKPKILPKEFKDILDNAKNGVIFMSFGTNVQSKDFGPAKISAIVDALSKLKQKIIWKYEGDLDNVPKNFYITKWAPQIEILSHPNTVLFITHCGLLSTQEIFYTGVPIVGVPFFLDQNSNAANLKARGFGQIIDFDHITTRSFYNVVNNVLENSTYRETAKKLSKLYHDIPNKPMDLALWWTNYILRHGSAKHLDLATRDMNFIQLYNFDLILLPFVAFIILTVLIIAICLRICSCSGKKVERSSKNKLKKH